MISWRERKFLNLNLYGHKHIRPVVQYCDITSQIKSDSDLALFRSFNQKKYQSEDKAGLHFAHFKKLKTEET